MKDLLKKIKAANSIEDLYALGIGRVEVDISYRGGGVGFYGSDVANFFGINPEYLPREYGAGCNYLGGGIRGSIFPSGYSKNVPANKASLLDELAKACVRAYKNAEDESGMNEEESEDGEVNWDAKASNLSRKAGIVSAY